MWVSQNQDGTYAICGGFAYLDDGKVVIINGDSDISKNYSGFKWEADQAELDRMAAVNKDYADTAKGGILEW